MPDCSWLLKPTQGHTFIPVPDQPEYVGKKFSEILALHHQKSGHIPIAVEKPNRELMINPKDYVMAEGDRLICVAPHEG